EYASLAARGADRGAVLDMMPADYIGVRSGNLRLLGSSFPTWKHARAECRCGEVITVRLADFIRGHVKSCNVRSCRMTSLVGRKFGRLTVTRYVDHTIKTRQARYIVECSCGRSKTVWSKSFVSGNTRSCGCLRKEISTKKSVAQPR